MNEQASRTAPPPEAMLRRALELESRKTIELVALRSTISTLELHRTLGLPKPPGLGELQATAQSLERDLKALREYQADHPLYRIEKLQGMTSPPDRSLP